MVRVLTNSKTKPERDPYWLPYQSRWIQDKSRNKIAEKSRRVGLSFAESYRRVRQASLAGAKQPFWVTSRDNTQAKLFLDDCKHWAKFLDLGAKDLGESVIDSERDLKMFSMSFSSGVTGNSMSSSPDAQAGKKGDRTLDEFGLHKKARELYGIAKPGTMWGGQFSVISTHRGSGHYFNEIIREIKEQDNPKRFSLHTITIIDAVKEGLWEKIRSGLPDDDEQKNWTADEFLQACRDECPDEEYWLQEFMCVPGQDGDRVLTWEDLVRCSYEKHVGWELPLNSCVGNLYLGFDVARHRDMSVIWILEEIANMLFTRRVIVMEKKKFSEQKAILWPLLRHKKMVRACIDATGLGMQIAEEAADEFGHLVHQVSMSMPVKEDLSFFLRGKFQDGSIRIPDTPVIHSDLRQVKTATTSAGNLVLQTEHSKHGHGDRFWALALAAHGQKTFSDPGAFSRFLSMVSKNVRTLARKKRTVS